MHGNQQARRFLLTINNPQKHDITVDTTKQTIEGMRSITYYCLATEIGEQGTPHIHLFSCFSAPVRFSTIKKRFPTAHIDKCVGTAQECRAYVAKEGKWKDTAKGETSTGDFVEWGILPEDKQGERKDLAHMYEMIKQGASDLDIFEESPAYIRFVTHIGKVRQALAHEQKQTAERDVEVLYLYGADIATRLRYIYNRYGFNKVYRVVDYSKHPFDGYNGEGVMVFDFFNAEFTIKEMTGMYMLGLPLELSCRYNNKLACYDTLIISSDVYPLALYLGSKPQEQKAFYEKIAEVLYFNEDGKVSTYTTKDLLKGRLPNKDNPFE